MKKACVYLTTYRGNKLPPFYIGSGWDVKIQKGYKGSVASAKYKHTWKQELITNPHLFKTVILFTCETREEAYKRENELQIKLDVANNPLYVNQYIQGITHSATTRKKISDTLKGKNYTSIETRVKAGAKRTGIKRTNLAKPIAQYSPEGNLIATFSSAYEAALHLGCQQDTICNAANGKLKHAKRFLWRYFVDQPLSNILPVKIRKVKSRAGTSKSKPVQQFTLEGMLVATYTSIKIAALTTGIAAGNIVSGIKANGTRGGYYWRYLE